MILPLPCCICAITCSLHPSSSNSHSSRFLGCVLHIFPTRILRIEKKIQLFWIPTFNSSSLLNFMVSPRASHYLQTDTLVARCNFHTATGTSHLVPYFCFCRWFSGSLKVRRPGRLKPFSLPHSIQMLYLTFINQSIITHPCLLGELDHILALFSRSWQCSWSSNIKWAARTIFVHMWTSMALLINVS